MDELVELDSASPTQLKKNILNDERRKNTTQHTQVCTAHQLRQVGLAHSKNAY